MDILASNPPALANSGADPFTYRQPYAISSIEVRAYSASSPGGSRAVRHLRTNRAFGGMPMISMNSAQAPALAVPRTHDMISTGCASSTPIRPGYRRVWPLFLQPARPFEPQP